MESSLIMRPSTWRPPVALSSTEQSIVKLNRRAKLFIWLREHRHELFDDRERAGRMTPSICWATLFGRRWASLAGKAQTRSLKVPTS